MTQKLQNNEEILIRPMREEDYDRIRELWQTIGGFGIRSIDDSREDIERFIRRNPDTSVVAQTPEGKVIGSILCGNDGRQGSLYHVCVAKPYRRRGIGTRLVSFCMQALQAEKISAEGLEKVYRDVELPLIPVMASMEYLGFTADADTLKSIGDGISARIEELTRQIYDLAGEEFNIKSTQQLGPILFEKLGLPAGKKTKKALVKGAKKVSRKVKKLKSKKQYTVKVRAYKTVNGKKYWGKWSTAKKVKVK